VDALVRGECPVPKTPPNQLSLRNDNFPITPRLLDIRQAAAYLNTSVHCLRQLEWADQLPSVRGLGKRILFDINDLNKLIEERKN